LPTIIPTTKIENITTNTPKIIPLPTAIKVSPPESMLSCLLSTNKFREDYVAARHQLVEIVLSIAQYRDLINDQEMLDLYSKNIEKMVKNANAMNSHNCPDMEYENAVDGLNSNVLELKRNLDLGFLNKDLSGLEKAILIVEKIGIYESMIDDITEEYNN
jgi:hypothetical protein